MDYTRFTGFRGGRGGARGSFGGGMPSTRIPDGGRTPMGVSQGGRTPAWGMASGSRSKRCILTTGCRSTNRTKLRHMEVRQLVHQPGSRTARLVVARLLMAVGVVQPSTPTMARARPTEGLQVV